MIWEESPCTAEIRKWILPLTFLKPLHALVAVGVHCAVGEAIKGFKLPHTASEGVDDWEESVAFGSSKVKELIVVRLPGNIDIIEDAIIPW